MTTTFREYLSDTLIDNAIERSLETQEFEQSLAAVPPTATGYGTAQYAVRSAKRRDAIRLWLGFRIHPRHIVLD